MDEALSKVVERAVKVIRLWSNCDECQREPNDPPKPWPIFTARIGGVEVCAKCLRRIER